MVGSPSSEKVIMARHNPTLGRARLQSSRSAIDPKAISAAVI